MVIRVTLTLIIAASILALLMTLSLVTVGNASHVLADDPSPPGAPVKLIFIHHSTGGNWLADPNEAQPYGGLGRALMDNNYYVSATNYSWGPDGIGDRTDIPNWPEWFTGPNSAAILAAVYSETSQNIGDFGAWPRLAPAPAGENQIIMFKSCFPNSNLDGQPDDPPYPAPNDWEYSVSNAKAVYNKILTYFQTRQDKLFVIITAPPLMASDTTAARAANARAFNNWLVNDWLDGYPHRNVAVFDYYNVLTSNGGNANTNDLGSTGGNHHRWWGGAVQHVRTVNNNYAAYPSGDSHPSTAGHQKATGEFVQLLNIFYNRWRVGSIYYVAPNGDDTNPGTVTQPWRTIQKAAQTLIAGNTVYIRGGTYHEQVVPQRSGSAGNLITYAASPGETVTIDGASVTLSEWDGLFNIVNQAYIRVSGLRVLNAKPNPHNPGILVDSSSHITIENNFVSRTNDSGIGVWSSDHVVVTHNEVEEACLSGFNESISVGVTDVFEVSYNRVHHSQKEGIVPKDGSSNGKVFGNEVYNTEAVGIYVDASARHTHDIAVYQNVVHDVADMGFAVASEVGGLLENVRLYNNIAYYNRHAGIWLSGCCPESSTHPVRNIQIVNNTLYNNGWQDWGGGIGIENTQAQTITIRNNIVSQNLYFQIAADLAFPPGQVVVDHNLIDGYRDTEGEMRGNDYVEGDPRFVNAAAADFHLRPDSPAIDRGAAQAAPGADFDGNPRPRDGDGDGVAKYDIGAYEFGTPAPRLYLPLIQKTSASFGTEKVEMGLIGLPADWSVTLP